MNRCRAPPGRLKDRTENRIVKFAKTPENKTYQNTGRRQTPKQPKSRT